MSASTITNRFEERRLPLRLSADDQQLQKVVRDFLAAVVPSPTGDSARWAVLDPQGRIWGRIGGELGLQSLAVAEEFGGQGFGVASLAVVFEELGRVTCAAPLFGTVALAGRVLTRLPGGGARDTLLASIAEGSLRATVVVADDATLVDGMLTLRASAVVDAVGADVLVVVARGQVLSVRTDADGVTITEQDGLDLTRSLGSVQLDGAPAELLAEDAADAVARGLAEATVLLAAELTGVARAALAEAVDYSKLRTQFGRQIGSFQALKHRMADMLVAAEGAWSTTRHAALLCDERDAPSSAELTLAVGVAKAAASSAAVFATGENVQIHGGIGFTWEHSAHLRFRRARSAAVLLGTAGEHRARNAALLTGGTHGHA